MQLTLIIIQNHPVKIAYKKESTILMHITVSNSAEWYLESKKPFDYRTIIETKIISLITVSDEWKLFFNNLKSDIICPFDLTWENALLFSHYNSVNFELLLMDN